MEVPTNPVVTMDPRQRDRRTGLLVVAVTFVLGLLVSAWAKDKSRPEISVPPGPPTQVGILGFPKAVDAAKTLGRARELTRRGLLRNILAEGVRSDGTVDLSEGPGYVRYLFQSPSGQGPQPAHEPGTLPRRLYCGRQTVVLRKEGLVAEPDATDYPCATPPVEPLPDPHCSPAEVWRHALGRGAAKDRLARIEYYRSSVGPAWRFDAVGGHQSFVLYGDCTRELDAHDARTVGP